MRFERHPEPPRGKYSVDHTILARAVPCPRCDAKVGQICYAPRNDGYPHAARQDRVVVMLGGNFVASKVAGIIADAMKPEAQA